MEYFRNEGCLPQSEGICGCLPSVYIATIEDNEMEIRVEIKMDNGSIDRTEIIGNFSSDTLLNLMNKFTNLYNSLHATSQQTAFAAPQMVNTPAMQPQPVQTTQFNQPAFQTSQTTLPKTPRTRNFGIAVEEYSQLKNESLTIKERLELFLNFEYKGHWFTSLEVKSDYDRIYGPINLSTVSTYLSRLYREDKLERTGNRNQRRYCIKELSEMPEYPSETAQFQAIRQK
ncbi:MAG: hypothetical protein SCH39_07225 [Methanosarcinales archaeon]|nr:hypothetical protein [ANME-2 cluster archaeon]MDF1531249.1 hypothetical protein [ANME-2 cluster archaeon]MDW7776107.1 hypothetical protein [Methanosarcinales archaeon]